MSVLTFVSSMTNMKLDKKVIKPDADGYYKVTLGAINIHNSSGDFYEYNNEVAELFKSSASLMMRLQNGALRSENGHPKVLPGMSKKDFIRRICTIEETLVCGHIKEINVNITERVDPGSNAPIVLITGLIRPEGMHGEALKSSLENPDSNTALSIRSLTADRMVGATKVKTLKYIVTWDFVIMPGIPVADKMTWASLESEDMIEFTESELAGLSNDLNSLEQGVSLESEKALFHDVIKVVDSCKDEGKSCLYNNW